MLASPENGDPGWFRDTFPPAVRAQAGAGLARRGGRDIPILQF
jgi:hypothetical protein